MTTKKGTLRNGWSLDLYDYLEDMPLRGWVWEFMRRDLLKKAFINPVDAWDRSAPSRLKLPHDFRYYCYMPYPEAKDNGVLPIKQSGVNLDRLEHRRVKDMERERMNDLPHKWRIVPRSMSPLKVYKDSTQREVKGKTRPVIHVEVKVDLSRKDSALRDDFGLLLKEFRRRIGRPNVYAEINAWKGSRVLQAWDLRQFDVSWLHIGEILELAPRVDSGLRGEKTAASEDLKSRARSSVDQGRDMIDKGKYKLLEFDNDDHHE